MIWTVIVSAVVFTAAMLFVIYEFSKKMGSTPKKSG